MAAKDQPLVIRDFGGVNRLDSGDRSAVNQFWSLTNFYQATRGQLSRRLGSTTDLSAAQLVGASRVNGIHRYYSNGERFTAYACVPNGTAFPLPTSDLTLTEISGGDLFNGGAVTVMRFCYTWVGLGGESNFNSRHRGSFVPGATTAATQLGHQSITVSANTKGVRVTIPAFPSGIRSANIFAARGGSTQMVYVGSVFTSAGHLDVLSYIGPSAAKPDTIDQLATSASAGGTLKPGTYYIGIAYLIDNGAPEGVRYDSLNATTVPLAKFTSITLETEGSIDVTAKAQAASNTSVNGATHALVFASRHLSSEFPMTFVGILKTNNTNTLTISSIPADTNAHTVIDMVDDASPRHSFATCAFTEDSAFNQRSGFVLVKDTSGTMTEVILSRGNYISEGIGTTIWGALFTSGDNAQGLTGDWETQYNATYFDPTIVSFQGRMILANGLNNLIHFDQSAMGFVAPTAMDDGGGGKLPGPLPERPGFLMVFKSSLLAAGSKCRSLVVASNAESAHNWATGGSGFLLKFATIGDPFQDSVTSLGIFSYTTGTDGPQSWFIAGKKTTAWTGSDIADPVAGISASLQQLSGRVGCGAYRTMQSTPIGMIFLGSDGDVYLSRGSGEPRPIGTGIKPILEHLGADDALMRMCTAVFHDNHWKLFYPSSSTSTGNDAQLWLDLRTADGRGVIWTGPHLGIGCGAQTVFVGDGDDYTRLGALAGSSVVAKLDDPTTFADLGTTTAPVIEGKQTRLGAPAHLKRIVGMVFDAYYDRQFTQSVDLELFTENDYALVPRVLSRGGAEWDVSDFSASLWSAADFQAVPCLLGATNLMGRTVKWKLTYTGTAQFILAEAVLLYKPERRLIAPL
jgi:hypothetical protein